MNPTPESCIWDELESPEAIESRREINNTILNILMNPDKTSALVSALRQLARHVDEDVPVEHRSTQLSNALAYAFELAEAFDTHEPRSTHP